MWIDSLRLRAAAVKGLAFRAVRPHELPIATQISVLAFGGSADDVPAAEERFRRHLEAGELWGVAADGRLTGVCRLLTVEHFFGGRPVRCMDVAGVAVPPEHRRKGVATALMEGAAAWGGHQGLGLSLLYPGVPSLYRRLGWEHAGAFSRYRLDQQMSVPVAETMRPAEVDDWSSIVACHDAYASTLTGAGRRRVERWRSLREGEAYVLDGGSGIEAYAVLYRGAEPGEGEDAGASLDWAATTPRGMRALASLVAGGAGAGATLHGPTPDVWAPWLDSWDIPPTSGLYWMARGLVLPAAISQRGFPQSLEAAVTVEVDDTLALESRGPWRLEVSGGRGSATPAVDADVVVAARAVGPLFTGFRSARELRLAGLVDGPLNALDVLSAMFDGPAPVALDFF